MKSPSDDAQPPTSRLALLGGLKRVFAWGLLDQLFSSATNFVLSLVGGRLLGASGLGVIAIGFSAYLITLSFQRSLLSEPLIVVSSVHDRASVTKGIRSSISATAGLGLAAASILVLLGVGIGGDIGRGLLIFAPWILPALLQDLWRMLLFRDDRGGAATANDAVWLITMFALLGITHGIRADWAVVACWGLGATVSTMVGFVQLRDWGARPRASWEWVIRDAWPVGKWFAAENSVYTIASQLVVFFLAGLTGAAAVGGLRSAQIIFAPVSILWPAVALPGLPLVRRTIEESDAAAKRLALKLSILLTLLTSVYVLACSVYAGGLLAAVFGDDFARYGDLIWPVGVHQVMLAAAGGWYLLLKAHGKGKRILFTRMLNSIVTLALLLPLSLRFGILGGAWAITLGASIGTVCIIVFALRVDGIVRARDVP